MIRNHRLLKLLLAPLVVLIAMGKRALAQTMTDRLSVKISHAAAAERNQESLAAVQETGAAGAAPAGHR